MIAAAAAATVLYLDSAPLIYLIEEHPQFSRLVDPIFEALDRGEKRGVSSYITLIEVMVRPIAQGQPALAERYRTLLLGSPYMYMVAVERDVAEAAARIRARYRFRLPDALHLATALLADVDLFVTNDADLRRFSGLPILVLGDHISTT